MIRTVEIRPINRAATNILDLALDWGLWLVLFLAPLKWGLPILEPDKAPFPTDVAEWLIGSWPPEVFCLSVYLLFFLHCVGCLMRSTIPRFGSWRLWAGPLVFLISSLISTRFSVHPSISLSYVLTYGAYVLLFFLLIGRPDTHRFLIAILCSATLVALYAIFQRYAGFSQTAQWAQIYMADSSQLQTMQAKLASGRVFSTLVYPNSLGGYLVMTLPLIVAWFWKEQGVLFAGDAVHLLQRQMPAAARRADRPESFRDEPSSARLCEPSSNNTPCSFLTITFMTLISLLQLIALVLTKSQGSLLTLGILIIGAAAYGTVVRTKGSRRMVLGLALFAATAFVLLLVPFKWNTFLVRWSYWVAALKMGLSNWRLGYGPGSFGVVYPHFRLDWGGQTQLAHSHFLQIFAEGGLMALMGWSLWWLGWMFPKKGKQFRGAVIPAGFKRESTSIRSPIKALGDDELNYYKKGLSEIGASKLRWGIAAGLIGFLIHGLVDFDFFVPGITIQAIFLCAVLWAPADVKYGDTMPIYKAKSGYVPIFYRVLSWIIGAALAFLLIVLPYNHFRRVALAQAYFSQPFWLMQEVQRMDRDVKR